MLLVPQYTGVRQGTQQGWGSGEGRSGETESKVDSPGSFQSVLGEAEGGSPLNVFKAARTGRKALYKAIV